MSNIASKKDILEYWGRNNLIKSLKGTRTLTEIADLIDIDQGQLSKQVNGALNISLYRLVQIAAVLDCKPSELLPQQWQASTQYCPENLYENIKIVTQTVEEFLIAKKKVLSEKKAELIASLCEATLNLTPEEKKAKVIEISDFITRRAI